MYSPYPAHFTKVCGPMRIFSGDLILRGNCYYVEAISSPKYEIEVDHDKWGHHHRSSVLLLGKPGINWRIVWQDPKIRQASAFKK